jgi:hypothetical protein
MLSAVIAFQTNGFGSLFSEQPRSDRVFDFGNDEKVPRRGRRG